MPCLPFLNELDSTAIEGTIKCKLANGVRQTNGKRVSIFYSENKEEARFAPTRFLFFGGSIFFAAHSLSLLGSTQDEKRRLSVCQSVCAWLALFSCKAIYLATTYNLATFNRRAVKFYGCYRLTIEACMNTRPK